MTSLSHKDDLVVVAVVDDRLSEQKGIRLLLEEIGYKPHFFDDDHRAAYQAIVAQQVQRLLVNYQFGGRKNLGAALLKKIQEKGPAIPTIVLNCHAGSRRAVSTHCDEFDFVLRVIEATEIYTQTAAIRNSFKKGTVYHFTSNIERPTVFVIHGRDVDAVKAGTATAVQRISKILKVDLSLEIVVLQSEPYTGETLIQQIERHFRESAFAVALFTADDLGCLKGETNYKERARQNVIYETGFARGYLGPQKTIIIQDRNIELPTDFGGVRTIDLELDDTMIMIELKKIFDSLKINAPIKII